VQEYTTQTFGELHKVTRFLKSNSISKNQIVSIFYVPNEAVNIKGEYVLIYTAYV